MATVYRKRPGTSGISGQLYETKLISLILFRLMHDDNIEEFYLSSNMNDIGAFDDVCFKMKIKDRDRPILVFIQAKHKEDDNTYLNFDLIKNIYASYGKLKNKFYSSRNSDHDIFFNGQFNETDFLFILYTNAKCFYQMNIVSEEAATSNAPPLLRRTRRLYQSEFSNRLNNLIATSNVKNSDKYCEVAAQPDYSNQDIQLVEESILEEEITILVEHFAKFLNKNMTQTMNIMQDEYILRYHVILAEKVVHVSEIQSTREESMLPCQHKATDVEEWRVLTFRSDFFNADDPKLTIFRNKIYRSVVKNQAHVKTSTTPGKTIQDSLTSKLALNKLISSFLTEPCALTLSFLIESYISYKNHKLKFNIKRPDSDTDKLEEINNSAMIDTNIINEAREIAAKTIISNLKLRVPITFGNTDLTIRGNDKKVDKRLNHLAKKIVELCETSKLIDSYEIVAMDESLGDGFLNINGGIGGAVGNLLVHDKVTNFLKFTENHTLLKNNARILLHKLSTQINNLQLYRFDVNILQFPKLVFDCSSQAKVILSKLVIYDTQGNQNSLEDILKSEIELCERASKTQTIITAKTDTLYLAYHHEIQEWWMSQETGLYLTKTNDIYQQAKNNIVMEPLLTTINNMFYISNSKCFGYRFSKNSIKPFELLEVTSKLIVIANITTLTVVKTIQFLRNKHITKYGVLDFECILNLPTKDFSELIAELKTTDKVLIVVCNISQITQARLLHKRIDELSEATNEKRTIVISTNMFVETVKEYFSVGNILTDEKQCLTDFTLESQQDIMNNARVLFQDQEVSLDLLIDDLSLIKADLLNKIIRNENIIIGDSIANPDYEALKNVYIDRKVTNVSELGGSDYIKSFYDIPDDVVLMAAAPGMGKSTLLTDLSLKTKEHDKTLWLVRINLIDYSEQFHTWQTKKIVFDYLETMQFMCRHIVNNSNLSILLKELNGKIYIESCSGDEFATFELNIFLHLYNNGKVIFLFDGFDEICPHYKDNIINLFNTVKKHLQRNKMWVTCRSYNEILIDLEKVLGKSHEVECIDDREMQMYLQKFWQDQIKIAELNDMQIKNVRSFIDSKKWDNTLNKELERVHSVFYDYLYSHFPHIDDFWTAAEIVPDCHNELIGRPLILYLIAEHFTNVIFNGEIDQCFKHRFNITNIYDTFIKTKLNKILFQDKNQMKIYNPYIIERIETARKECITMHIKLAACVIFGNPLFKRHRIFFDEFKDMAPFKEDDLADFEFMVNKIKGGKEKTGLISHITPDNVPVFVHRTFAEYFANEFLCGIFKSNHVSLNDKKLLYATLDIFHDDYPFLLDWMNNKIEIDRELNRIVKDLQDKLPLLWSRPFIAFEPELSWSLEERIRFMNSSSEDYEVEFFLYHILIQVMNGAGQMYRNVKNDVIGKMKPHFKKYFTATEEIKALTLKSPNIEN